VIYLLFCRPDLAAVSGDNVRLGQPLYKGLAAMACTSVVSVIVLLLVQRPVCCDISVVSSSPHDGSVVEEGGSVSLLCQTDRRWFLCLWTSPLGDKQCAIQESEEAVSQVCQGDPRIMVQGESTHCGITVSNVTSEDWGAWMCLVQDGDEFKTDRREIDLEIGRAVTVDLKYKEEKNLTNSERVLRVTEGEVEEIACFAEQGYPSPSFSWEGPTPYARRVRKYVKEMPKVGRWRGNISLADEDTHIYDPTTHLYSSQSTILYSANMNDTNSSISCQVSQADMSGNLLYTQHITLRIVVDPLPTPLAKVDRMEQMGIIAGVILSIVFLLLLLVILIVFICHRTKSAKSVASDTSEYQVKPVWRTESSGFENWSACSQPGHDKAGSSASDSESSSNSPETGSVIRPGTRSTKTLSDSESYQTEREIVEVEHVGISFCPAPSLHETHFGSSVDTLPLTTLHPPGLPVHLPDRMNIFGGLGGSVSFLEPYWRKPSSTRSDGYPCCKDSFSISSRPVSAMDLYLQPSHIPQRISTPTCPGSKTSISLFQCPHDCFTETDVTEDTIEEIDEEDMDSLNKLVRQGLDTGTDCLTDSSEEKERSKKTTAVTSL